MTSAEAGQRLDKVLVEREPTLSRRLANELFAARRVLVEGHPARKGDRARQDTEIEFELPMPRQARPDPDAPLELALERPDIVVVNKPPGQPTAPLGPTDLGSVANALAARFPEMQGIGHDGLEPGLIHRLDTGTSGLLVAARTSPAFDTLSQALREGRLTKRYLAIVSGLGLADHGAITDPIAPHPRSPRRVAVCASSDTPGARPARTTWQVLRRSTEGTLVEIEVSRAVRHQIRVHFAALGHPLLGDTIYGGPPCDALGGGHALHASYVAWAGDATVRGFELEATPPPGMGVLIGG